MELARTVPQEEGNPTHTERLAEEEEISLQVLEARKAGKTRAGDVRAIPGTGIMLKETTKGPRPHDKPNRRDPNRRDTVRGNVPVEPERDDE